MKCKKCGIELKNEKFCPECGTKAPSQFKQKVETENLQKEKKKKLQEKHMERQKRIVEEKGLKNQYISLSFIFGAIGAALVLWPAGLELQLQWWYSVLIIVCGFIGYLFASKARKVNVQYFNRYRVYLQPKLTKAGLILSVFSLGAGIFMGTFVFALYL